MAMNFYYAIVCIRKNTIIYPNVKSKRKSNEIVFNCEAALIKVNVEMNAASNGISLTQNKTVKLFYLMCHNDSEQVQNFRLY